VFNDRDSFFTDWYFMLFISMMTNSAKPEMFRSMNNQSRMIKDCGPGLDADEEERFGSAVNLEARDEDVVDVAGDDEEIDENPEPPATKRQRKSKETKESTASAQFGKLVKVLAEMGKSLVERFGALDGGHDQELSDDVKKYLNDVVGGQLEVNTRLSSHSGKRHGVNLAHNSPYVKTSWVLVCSGWVVKGLHTLFDYVDFSSSSARHVARARNGWTAPLHGNQEGLEGGRPAMLSSLATLVNSQGVSDLEIAEGVCHRLFFDYQEISGANDNDLQKLLFATFLKVRCSLFQLLLTQSFCEMLQRTYPGSSSIYSWIPSRNLGQLKMVNQCKFSGNTMFSVPCLMQCWMKVCTKTMLRPC
jgi:hypothetical protein